MKNTKTAILFYGKNKVPIPFDEYKEYDVGTGYVALYDEQNHFCILCRILDEREISSFFKTSNKLILKHNSSADIDELMVVIICTDLGNLSKADNIIERITKKHRCNTVNNI